MNKQEKLLGLLYYGLLEIRLLSTKSNRSTHERINRLSNILHNIPKYILDVDSFNFSQLKDELLRYEEEFSPSGINLSKII